MPESSDSRAALILGGFVLLVMLVGAFALAGVDAILTTMAITTGAMLLLVVLFL